MASTTIDTETELSAVNSILGAISQSPVTSIAAGSATPEVSFIYNLLRDSNIDVQSEGWHFNTEKHVPYTPDATTGRIVIGSDILQIDVTKQWTHRHFDVVRRDGYLYDKLDHTDDWGDYTTVDLDITKLFSFEDLPAVFQRYIIARASARAATQLVGNPQLAQLLQQQEGLTRAACMEYECNQGNNPMFGLPEDSVYTGYRPWTTLRR